MEDRSNSKVEAFFQPFNLAKTTLSCHLNTRTARLETRTHVCLGRSNQCSI